MCRIKLYHTHSNRDEVVQHVDKECQQLYPKSLVFKFLAISKIESTLEFNPAH